MSVSPHTEGARRGPCFARSSGSEARGGLVGGSRRTSRLRAGRQAARPDRPGRSPDGERVIHGDGRAPDDEPSSGGSHRERPTVEAGHGPAERIGRPRLPVDDAGQGVPRCTRASPALEAHAHSGFRAPRRTFARPSMRSGILAVDLMVPTDPPSESNVPNDWGRNRREVSHPSRPAGTQRTPRSPVFSRARTPTRNTGRRGWCCGSRLRRARAR